MHQFFFFFYTNWMNLDAEELRETLHNWSILGVYCHFLFIFNKQALFLGNSTKARGGCPALCEKILW